MAQVTLTEFLLARITEDEKTVELDEQLGHISQQGFVRAMAECEAKRAIVEAMQPFGRIDDMFAPEIFALLALPYADHPDYLPEWKP